MPTDKKYTLDELEGKLTKKERIFCHQVIIDWNGSKAARIAGYSKKTCAEIGYENLRKPHIEQYIAFIKEDLEKESGITKLKVLNELNKIAFSSISHLHDTWIQLKEFDDLTDDQRASIESIDTKTETRREEGVPDILVNWVKIKLYAKGPSLDIINKMNGYYAPEKLDIRTPGKEIKLNFDE